MSVRLGLVLVALACAGAALFALGDVDPIDLLAVAVGLTAVAVVVTDRRVP